MGRDSRALPREEQGDVAGPLQYQVKRSSGDSSKGEEMPQGLSESDRKTTAKGQGMREYTPKVNVLICQYS